MTGKKGMSQGDASASKRQSGASASKRGGQSSGGSNAQAEAKKRQAERMAARQRRAANRGPKIIAEHKVKSGDTLSHIALEHYGSATRDKWMQIYEANKEELGEPAPGRLMPGMVLDIPEDSD